MKGPFGAETPSRPMQEMCKAALALAKVTSLTWPAFPRAETPLSSPGQGWPLHRAPKVQPLQRFLISTSQEQMEMVSAAASPQEAK